VKTFKKGWRVIDLRQELDKFLKLPHLTTRTRLNPVNKNFCLILDSKVIVIWMYLGMKPTASLSMKDITMRSKK
jgi:hypothetical protein